MTEPLAPGSPVRLTRRHRPGHHQMPAYAMGRRGVVIHDCGPAEDAEALAHGRAPEARRVYRVRLSMADLWPGAAPGDSLELEVYDHWLEPCDAP
jgi:nitrile hydratase